MKRALPHPKIAPSTSDAGPLSAAAQRLAELAQSHAEVAARLGVSKGAVAGWRSGRRSPSRSQRERIAAVLGIDPGLWGRRSAAVAGRASDAASAPQPPQSPRGSESKPTLEETVELLRRIDEMLAGPGVDPATAEKLLQRKTSALRLKHQIEAADLQLRQRVYDEMVAPTLAAMTETINNGELCPKCAVTVAKAVEACP